MGTNISREQTEFWTSINRQNHLLEKALKKKKKSCGSNISRPRQYQEQLERSQVAVENSREYWGQRIDGWDRETREKGQEEAYVYATLNALEIWTHTHSPISLYLALWLWVQLGNWVPRGCTRAYVLGPTLTPLSVSNALCHKHDVKISFLLSLSLSFLIY